MKTADITRVANKTFPAKSSVATYRLPGGGGFLWAGIAGVAATLPVIG